MNRFDGKSKQAHLDTLKVFETVAKPKLVSAVTTDMVDQFATKRLEGKGIKGRKLSPATVNKDLRYIRAMMRVVHDWGFVSKGPRSDSSKRTPSSRPTSLPNTSRRSTSLAMPPKLQATFRRSRCLISGAR